MWRRVGVEDMVCTFVWVFTCVQVHAHMRVCACRRMCTRVWMCAVCAHAPMCTCVHVSARMQVRTCEWVRAHVSLRVGVCEHICTLGIAGEGGLLRYTVT